MHEQRHEGHSGDLPDRLQPEQRVAGADRLQEADAVGLECRHRLGEASSRRPSRAGGRRCRCPRRPSRRARPGRRPGRRGRPRARSSAMWAAARSASARVRRAPPAGALAAAGEDPAEVAVDDEHHGADEQEHGEVEPGHQVAVEEHERDRLDADTDPHRDERPGQPRSVAEPAHARRARRSS